MYEKIFNELTNHTNNMCKYILVYKSVKKAYNCSSYFIVGINF